MEIQKVNFNVSYGLRLRFPLGGKLCLTPLLSDCLSCCPPV